MACAAIIVASGSSRRMGFDKLAAELHGKPVIVHTVAAFMRAEGISRVVVVCPPERFELLANEDFLKPLERRGLVKTTVDPIDRRGRRLLLTPVGRRLLRAALPVWQRTQRQAEQLLASADTDGLRAALRALS